MTITYAYQSEKLNAAWETNIDLDALPEATKRYALARGLHEALKDTFAGAKDAAEFESGLDKKLEKILSGDMPEYVPGGRGAGQPKDPRAEMVNRVANEMLRQAAKVRQKKLPKVDSDDYKALFTTFKTANLAAIEAEADIRLAKNATMEVTLPEGF